MLDIKKNIENEKATFVLSGRIDTITAPELEQEIKASVNGVTELALDMKKLDYISSAGLRVLLAAHRIMDKQGKMTILNANESVMEIFEVTGFSDILTIE